MTVYLIAQLNIHDRTKYSNYESGFMEVFAQHKGKLLSVDEAPNTLEGVWAFTRTVLIEFPSEDDANAWYQSEAYQTLMQHRLAASDGNIVMINGFPNQE